MNHAHINARQHNRMNPDESYITFQMLFKVMELSSTEQLECMLSEVLYFAESFQGMIVWEEADKIFDHWFNTNSVITDSRRVGKLLYTLFRCVMGQTIVYIG